MNNHRERNSNPPHALDRRLRLPPEGVAPEARLELSVVQRGCGGATHVPTRFGDSSGEAPGSPL